MWVRRSAIRPVPAWARVPEHAVIAATDIIPDDAERTPDALDEHYVRFLSEQTELAGWFAEEMNKPMDETAAGLGYFAGVVLWLAFERAFGASLGRVDAEGLRAARELLELDEELRRTDAVEVLETDEVIALQQPALVSFLNAHVEITLEAHAERIDVDDVDRTYRLLLVVVLALSHAVERPPGYPVTVAELPA